MPTWWGPTSGIKLNGDCDLLKSTVLHRTEFTELTIYRINPTDLTTFFRIQKTNNSPGTFR